MQNNSEPNETTERGSDHSGESDGLTKRDVIGAVSLIVVVAGIGAGYYAFNYVSKDSVRVQFWVGFMFSFTALVVVTLQVLIYAQQAEFMKQQANSSSQLIELMVANERAYMRVGNWKLPRIENGLLHVEGRLKNSGRTIAGDVTTGCLPVRIGYRGPRDTLPLIPKGENTWISYGSIDSTESMRIMFDPIEVTDKQTNGLYEGEISIFVDGVCRYFDGMGGKSYYTYGFTLNFKGNVRPRYEHHHRVKA